MRSALAIALSLALSAPAVANTPAQQIAPAAAQQLDKLFGALAKAGSEENAKPIEAQILTLFHQSGSPSVDILMARASAALQGGDPDTAAKLTKAVTEISPNFADGWRVRGELLQDAKDDEGAIICLQKAITLNPRHFQAYFELAEILADYGDKPAALQYFRKAQALDPYLDGIDHQVNQLSQDVEGNKI